jgi:hypothetical protein
VSRAQGGGKLVVTVVKWMSWTVPKFEYGDENKLGMNDGAQLWRMAGVCDGLLGG